MPGAQFMKSPHIRLVSCWALILLTIPSLFISNGLAQGNGSDLELALALYKNHDYLNAKVQFERAIEKRKQDPIAWHYLGLTLEALDEKSGATKAHEKAAKLGESLIISRLRKTEPRNGLETLTRFFEAIASAANSARHYVPLNSDSDEWTNRLNVLQDVAELLKPKGRDVEKKVFFGMDVSKKARITNKPEPQYTDAARASRVSGHVVLYMTLADDGKVRSVVPIKGVSHGLTEEAIRVARQVGFTPAEIDGRPVSIMIRVEYFFEIH